MRFFNFTLAGLAALALMAVPAVAQETRTISVRGESSLEVRNDTATVVFGVPSRAREAGRALRRSSAGMRRVIAALTELGIERTDIETLDFHIRRITERRGERRVRLFEATNRIRVTVHEVRRTGEVIGAAAQAGATDVSRLTFSRSDARELYREQLVSAFDDARDKAEALAERAELTLGDPLRIEESGFRDGVEAPAAAEFAVGEAGSVPIRPGMTKIKAKVFVVFEAE